MPRWYSRDASPYWMIVKAAIATKYPLQRLELGHTDNGVPLQLFRLFESSDIDLSSLKTLKLTLSPELGYSYLSRGYEADNPDFERKVEDMDYFFHFLSSATNLETLSLSTDGWQVQRGLHAVAFWGLAEYGHYGMLVPRLRELELDGHQIDIAHLFKFISDRKATLQRLKLTRVRDYGKDYGDCNLQWVLEIIGGAGKQIRQVEMVDSYNGDAWVTEYSRRSGLYLNDA